MKPTRHDPEEARRLTEAGHWTGRLIDTHLAAAADHAPHARDEKEVPFEQAPMGTTGLETAFAAVYTHLVLPGALPLGLVVDKLSSGAALQALFMGLFVYRASPRGAGVPVLVRWLATATVLAVALHFVPQPEGFIQLCLHIGLVLTGFAAGVMLLGERDLFKPGYWSMRKA